MAGLVTAALIVRDEGLVLAECLRSISGVVDEIVVVDTGSVDDSVAIAADFGARVHRRAWTDHFAEARNAALYEAGGEWILYIDAEPARGVDGRGPSGIRTALGTSRGESPVRAATAAASWGAASEISSKAGPKTRTRRP